MKRPPTVACVWLFSGESNYVSRNRFYGPRPLWFLTSGKEPWILIFASSKPVLPTGIWNGARLCDTRCRLYIHGKGCWRVSRYPDLAFPRRSRAGLGIIVQLHNYILQIRALKLPVGTLIGSVTSQPVSDDRFA
ncbi:hypothetical protein F5J12DRAFT_744525 [Pisolithus orientalis]|uniref:uncharacterized protein n=1 Tax=Pisolithus orientalis TaxID=936130 RepID=UPI0022254674|nr:uncharacterized protein F5J12DRAFT_744525 [Pisolithus orientalis]KAI6002311.1 hypothetical protein F5J12DRAFT_744525 [Pisolithus orientalis]